MDNLLRVGFIREVKYQEWLANVVVVPKKGGKWRVCVDYTYLNEACPKDSFPLPRIDQIVDASSGHGMLSFLNAFSGYHQIPMYPPDVEKTSFITPPRALLLQRDVIRVKEHRGHLPKTGNQDVSATTRENYGSVYRRYVDKVQGATGSCYSFATGIRPPQNLWYETQSRKMCIRGQCRSVPGVHDDSEGD